MPLQVTALIHWQALRLWLKRVPFHHKPPFVPGEGSVRRVSERTLRRRAAPRAAARSKRVAVAILERALAGLEGGALEVDAARRHARGASAAGRRCALDDPRPRASSGGSRPAARSASASRTRRASGTTDDLVGLLRAPAPERRAPRSSGTPRVRRLLERAPAAEPPQRAPARAPQHRLPLRPRQRPLRADARRDDDLLVRGLRAAGRAARRRAAAQARAGLRQARARRPTTTCSRSAAAGAASRSRAAGEYGCRVTGLTISREQAALARERVATRASPTASRSVEQDYRMRRGPLHEGRVDRDARGDRRAAVRDLLRDDRPRCSRPAAAPASRRSSIPDERWDRYRRDARLDRALRLPRLPDPLARRRSTRAATPSVAARRSTSVEEIGAALRRDAPPLARELPRAASTRCARSATTSASSARGTSTSRSARRPSARARCATCS